MKAGKIISILIFIGLSIITALSFQSILETLSIKVGFGWTLSSILARLFVIILFSFALKQVFSLIQKTKNIKFVFVFLIALLPGFGISFLSPIYNTDYGILDDQLKITSLEILEDNANSESFSQPNEKFILAFFTSTCPHCMSTSAKLGKNIDKGQKLSVHAVFPSTQEDANTFLKNNRGEKFIPHLVDDATFTKLAGNTFPSVYLMNADGQSEKHWTGDMINYTVLDLFNSIEP